MPFVPAYRVVPVLGLGTTFGLTVSGIALLVLVRRECGPAALRRVPRAFLAGLAGCAAGAVAGAAVSSVVSGAVPALPAGGFLVNVGAVACSWPSWSPRVFAAVVLRLDGGDLRAALSRLRARAARVTRATRRSATGTGPEPPRARHACPRHGGRRDGAHVRMLAHGTRRGRGRRVGGRAVLGRRAVLVLGRARGVVLRRGDRRTGRGPAISPASCGCGNCSSARRLATLLPASGGGHVVHAHGLRAGALTVLALAARRRRAAARARGHGAQRAAGRGSGRASSTGCLSAWSPGARTWCSASRLTWSGGCGPRARAGWSGPSSRPLTRPPVPSPFMSPPRLPPPRQPLLSRQSPLSRRSPASPAARRRAGPRCGGAAGRARGRAARGAEGVRRAP